MATGTRILVGVAFLLASLPGSSASPTEGTLSFDDRVRHQRAIEEVYWGHRIWPRENPTPKPALSSVLSEQAIHGKVDDYMRKSTALEALWRRPVTAEQLQAEIDRMVRDTRDGATLAEVFHALGDDPYVIAETFVRHTLVDRLVRDWYASDARFHGALKARAEAARQACASVPCMKDMGGDYRETTYSREARSSLDRSVQLDAGAWTRERARVSGPVGRVGGVDETRDAFLVTALVADGPDEFRTATVTWPKRSFDAWWAELRASLSAEVQPTSGSYAIRSIRGAGCTLDTWTPTFLDAPDPAEGHTAVWTGSEMIVWGTTRLYSVGGRYNPVSDTWTQTSTGLNVPTPRFDHTAVWTGTEMLVWGGSNRSTTPPTGLNDGARYNPASDTWTPIAASGSPSARTGHTAVWTGAVMVVWGGAHIGILEDGGRYSPSLDSWAPVSSVGAPTARYRHTAVWTASEMIVWGGESFGSQRLDTGARFDPANNTWTATLWAPGTAGFPTARSRHTAVWTGSEMIVWGGESSSNQRLDTGARFNPASNTWTATLWAPGTAGFPTPRSRHTAVWTGSRMVIWGGHNGTAVTDTGGIYDPGANSWVATSVGPSARFVHTAVWTGTEMIVWGGVGPVALNTGGRLNPVTNTWVPTSTGSDFPAARVGHSAVWTGTEMIVWGGTDHFSILNTGGRYDPVTDSWTPTSTGANVPAVRSGHTAIWSGTHMVVSGGNTTPNSTPFGRYDPLTDSWLPSSISSTRRLSHTAIWTGTEMIVWGGEIAPLGTLSGDGIRYNPTLDSSSPVTLDGAPPARAEHTVVWTGSEMIVWGGTTASGGTNTGGRYTPGTDSWIATPTGTGVPAPRLLHSAVWTGTEMIVWGGLGDNIGSTGGRFNPSTNSWLGVSEGANVPSPRDLARAVWTGAEMIVWGGRPPGAIEAERLNSGGRYDPTTDTWLPTSLGANVPAARAGHTAVWTGTQMIVWGGGDRPTATGGLYCVGCAVNSDCADGNPCTDDVCTSQGTCSNPIAAGGTSCDDGLICTGTDTCDAAGVCVHTGDPCFECYRCIESVGACFPALENTACGDPSTTECSGPDSCNGDGVCRPNNFSNGDPCENACACQAGVCTGPSLYWLIVGPPGGLIPGQSFSETRGVDVTLLTGVPNQVVEALTLNALNIGVASASVGARIYNSSTGALLASGQTTVFAGAISARVPITATLVAGGTYRLAFYINAGPAVSGTLFDPDPTGVGGFPYIEPEATFQIDQGYSITGDAFPTNANIFIPYMAVETHQEEINNGQDDQCAGQPGFGQIDELSAPLGFRSPGNKDLLSWSAQGGALTYEVARGSSRTFSQGCTIFSVSTNSFTDTTVPAASQSLFYLVRSSAPNIGSWGEASSGTESSVPCAP